MNKLGLIGLFAAGAALLLAADKSAANKRDIFLQFLAQGLSDENLERSSATMMLLARDYGHQVPVQNCLLMAVEDAGLIFGHARAIPLLTLVKEQTSSANLVARVDSCLKTLNDRSRDQERARDATVRALSQFLHKSGFAQVDFGTGPADVKYSAGDKLMSPEQFLKRHDATIGPSPQRSLRLS